MQLNTTYEIFIAVLRGVLERPKIDDENDCMKKVRTVSQTALGNPVGCWQKLVHQTFIWDLNNQISQSVPPFVSWSFSQSVNYNSICVLSDGKRFEKNNFNSLFVWIIETTYICL